MSINIYIYMCVCMLMPTYKLEHISIRENMHLRMYTNIFVYVYTKCLCIGHRRTSMDNAHVYVCVYAKCHMQTDVYIQ